MVMLEVCFLTSLVMINDLLISCRHWRGLVVIEGEEEEVVVVVVIGAVIRDE